MQILYACQYPQKDQHKIVCGIGECKIGASFVGEVDSKKAGGDGEGRGKDVGGVKAVKDKVKNGRDEQTADQHCADLAFGNGMYSDLGAFSVVRMPHPSDQRKDGHGHCHAKIGDHLPVISKGKGDDPVKKTEHDHQKLAERISLCVENEGGNADQGGKQHQVIFTTKEVKGEEDQKGGKTPQHDFKYGKITEHLFFQHNDLKKISIRIHIFKDLTMCNECNLHFSTRWQYLYAFLYDITKSPKNQVRGDGSAMVKVRIYVIKA